MYPKEHVFPYTYGESA